MINAGDLTERITLQAKTFTRDTYNQKIESHADVVTVWAQVIMSGGREFYAAQKLYAETSAVFKIRYRTGLKPTMRIKWGNRYFSFICPPIDPDNARTEFLIYGKEVV